ncbi:MAG TPA: hypothetical protein DD412_07580 [Holosporales bacterium]|nr:hypothetical protein [Holosporales bacterium]
MKRFSEFFKKGPADSGPLVRKKQIIIIVMGLTVVCGSVFFLQAGVKKVTRVEKKVQKAKKTVIGDVVDARDIWAARLEGQVLKMAEVAQNFKTQNELQEKRLKTLEDALMAQERGKSKPNPTVKDKSLGKTVQSAGFNSSGFKAPMRPQTGTLGNTFPSGGTNSPSGQPVRPFKKILHFSVGSEDNFHHANDYVVAGTYVKAVTTSKLVVSTSVATQGNPQPIIMRLADHGNQPRGWKSRLKDAVMIGSCYGDISSERAMCRIHSLSFIEASGRKIEKKVEGWIFGEDGGAGLRGKVVDKAGKVVREAFVAGMLSGLGDFFKSSAQSSVFPVSPFGQTNALKTDDVLKSGAAQGASNALEKLADFSIKRAENMSPVLVVHPGRVVDIVFKKGFDLKSLTASPLRAVSTSSNSSGGN